MEHKRNIIHRLGYAASVMVLLAFVVGVYAAGVYQISHFNDKMLIPEGADNVLAQLDLNSRGTFRSPSGLEVAIDMGSRHSFITKDAVKHLESIGYPICKFPTLLLTHNYVGRYHVYTQKVSMPVRLPGPDGDCRLENCEMLIEDNEAGNIIGMDLLRYFVLEHEAATNRVKLLRNVPDDYVFVSHISATDRPIVSLSGIKRRVYITLAVNDANPADYFFDTGPSMAGLQLIQPLSNAKQATSPVVPDSITGLMTQQECRVMVGNRMKFAPVAYCDTVHTDDYSINPFNFFYPNDIVLDLPRMQLLYRANNR